MSACNLHRISVMKRWSNLTDVNLDPTLFHVSAYSDSVEILNALRSGFIPHFLTR